MDVKSFKGSLQFHTSQSEPDASTFHVLLTHAGDNLGDVQWRPWTNDRNHYCKTLKYDKACPSLLGIGQLTKAASARSLASARIQGPCPLEPAFTWA